MTVDPCRFAVTAIGFGPLFAAYDGWIPVDPDPGGACGKITLSEILAGSAHLSATGARALVAEALWAHAALSETERALALSERLAASVGLSEDSIALMLSEISTSTTPFVLKPFIELTDRLCAVALLSAEQAGSATLGASLGATAKLSEEC